jgi:predicted extracellular nuclease
MTSVALLKVRSLFTSALILMGAHAMGANQDADQHITDDKLGECGDYNHKSYHRISDVQGSGFNSPLLKAWVIIEGLVTVSLQGSDQYRGFWLQEPRELSGSVRYSENTSRGIFVYHYRQPVIPGQRVRLLAQVVEYKGLTEVKNIRAINVCDDGIMLPAAEMLTLPVSSLLELEAKEGMRVSLSQELVVSDLYGAGYGLGNYGQFAVSSQLHMQPTELWTAAQLREFKSQGKRFPAKELDYLLIDDASAKTFPKYIPYFSSSPRTKLGYSFSADNPIRISDHITNIVGILHAYNDHYVIIPEDISAIKIQPSSRKKYPAVHKSSNLIIASMNLGNYFNGEVAGTHKNKGFPTRRGARSYAGFLLQTEKIVSALMAMDADIIALMEVENDGYGNNSAIQYLTHSLNRILYEKLDKNVAINLRNKHQYRYIQPIDSALTQGKLGRDVISVGLLYRPEKVSLKGAVKVLDSRTAATPLFDDKRNRPSLIQQFSFKGHEFVIAVNHFKSKGRPCDEVEVDALQGNCNKTRYRAALALADVLKTSIKNKPLIPSINKQQDKQKDKQNKTFSLPTLILGDLNSYSQEEPLLALYDAGFINLKYHYDSKLPSFSYSFQGLLGNLDHALANSELLPFIKSVDSWHINSVEDVLLDYNKEDNGHKHPSIDTYGEPDMYRSSDHDPVVVGLHFPDI